VHGAHSQLAEDIERLGQCPSYAGCKLSSACNPAEAVNMLHDEGELLSPQSTYLIRIRREGTESDSYLLEHQVARGPSAALIDTGEPTDVDFDQAGCFARGVCTLNRIEK
jgi:hypothetical protein